MNFAAKVDWNVCFSPEQCDQYENCDTNANFLFSRLKLQR